MQAEGAVATDFGRKNVGERRGTTLDWGIVERWAGRHVESLTIWERIAEGKSEEEGQGGLEVAWLHQPTVMTVVSDEAYKISGHSWKSMGTQNSN